MDTRRMRCRFTWLLATIVLLSTLLPPAPLTPVLLAAPPVQEPLTPDESSTVYLPRVSTGAGVPDVRIIAPGDGQSISGMQFFAIQAVEPANVQTVVFKADDQMIGSDSTAADGFRLLFDADSFGDGPLTLTAEATGPAGNVTRQVTVNVVVDPPASAVIGPAGGLLQSSTGSLIRVPPGALSQASTFTVTERTQAQVTAENGIDWEQLGITFLGDQMITGSTAFSLPLQVSSAGYGNRVQPGQAVVNYTLLPDANGDGIDELVVINTATVAPNNDVVSDPVPQVLVKSVQADVSARTRTQVSAAPGAPIRLRINGLNPGSMLGNVAVWTSLEDGTSLEIPGRVQTDPTDPTQMIFSTRVPPLTAGGAALRVKNLTTGSISDATEIQVLPTPPLIRPAQEILSQMIDDTLIYYQNLPTSTPDQVDAVNRATALMQAAKSQFAQIAGANLSPEQQDVLNKTASLVQNASSYSVGQPGGGGSGWDADSEIGNASTDISFWSWAMGVIAVGIGWEAAAIVAGTMGTSATILGYVALHCRQWLEVDSCFDEYIDPYLPDPPELIFCLPTMLIPGAGGLPTPRGAGSAPQGGVTCGNVFSYFFGDTASRASLSQSVQGRPRYIIKAYLGTRFFPLSAAVDAGGYFFLPLIPQGEPYTVVAIDTLTQAARTYRGIGPAQGGLDFIGLDFVSQPDDATLAIGQTITGSITSASVPLLYPLYAKAGQGAIFRLMPTAGELRLSFQVIRPDGTVLCGRLGISITPMIQAACAFDQEGYYVLAIADEAGSGPGVFALFTQRTDNPTHAQSVNYNGVADGNVANGVALDAFRFNGANGDQLLARVARANDTFSPQIYVFRPDGTQLCDQFGSLPLLESRCTLDVDGVHTMLVGDALGTGSGAFHTYLQRINNPVGASSLVFGEAQAANIDPAHEMDAFTFSVNSGQKISVNVTKTAGAMNPELRVHRPDGSILCQATALIGNTAAQECNVDASGIHTLLVGDFLGNDTGAYTVTVDVITSR